MRDVVVIGAGLHRYGVFPEKTNIDMGTEAISHALKDAGMAWKDIEAAYCGTMQPGVSGGHAICNKMGFTSLGITLVENASASGSSAFREAYLSVASGENDIVLAFGIDKLGSQLQMVQPQSKQPQPKPENAVPPEPEQPQPEPENKRVDFEVQKGAACPILCRCGPTLHERIWRHAGTAGPGFGQEPFQCQPEPLCALSKAMHTGAGQ